MTDHRQVSRYESANAALEKDIVDDDNAARLVFTYVEIRTRNTIYNNKKNLQGYNIKPKNVFQITDSLSQLLSIKILIPQNTT